MIAWQKKVGLVPLQTVQIQWVQVTSQTHIHRVTSMIWARQRCWRAECRRLGQQERAPWRLSQTNGERSASMPSVDQTPNLLVRRWQFITYCEWHSPSKTIQNPKCGHCSSMVSRARSMRTRCGKKFHNHRQQWQEEHFSLWTFWSSYNR